MLNVYNTTISILVTYLGAEVSFYGIFNTLYNIRLQFELFEFRLSKTYCNVCTEDNSQIFFECKISDYRNNRSNFIVDNVHGILVFIYIVFKCL